MEKQLHTKITLLYFLLFLIPSSFFGQESLSAKFVIENGKFLFDEEGYKVYTIQKKEHEKSLKNFDSIKKFHPEMHINFIDDRTLQYPRFDSATVVFKNKIVEGLKLKNAKVGQNIISVLIDKYGKVKKSMCIKSSDQNICDQIQKMVFSDSFDKWTSADVHGIKVAYDFQFSIIIDQEFSKYNLKNRWNQETNLSDFKDL